MEINNVINYVIYSLIFVVIACVLRWWNEIWYTLPVKGRCQLFKVKLPPGYMGLPLFGEYFTFLWYFHFFRRPDYFITSKMNKYGKNVGAYKTYLYGCPSIIACSPTLCKRVLTSPTGFKQGWPSSQVNGTHSVTTINGPRHQLLRGFLSSEFNHSDSLAWVTLRFQPCIQAALQSWSQIGRINTFHQVKLVTLEFMGRYMGGLEIGHEVEALEKLFYAVNDGVRAQPWNFPGTPYRHALQCRKKLTTKLKMELTKKKTESDRKSEDMMDRLMQVKDKEGELLSDEEIVDNVLSNIAISYIGIAYPVTWSIYFLAKNPHVLHKVREENMKLANEKKKNGCDVTYEDFLKLKYTNKVLEETIRIASISGFIFKKATEDLQFEGYLIPKGWNVLVWLRFLHIDPTNFEDPLTFNPDRWESRPKHGMYLPFGGGPRTCPGSMLTRLTTLLFLHHLVLGYRWELTNPDKSIIYLSHPVPSDGVEILFTHA